MWYNKRMKISLIIPVYNKAPFVKRCFDSLVAQTEQDFQCIVVDDGSTDGSADICQDYCKRYGWEYYKIKHSGVAEARNFGMSKAKNEYLAFLDADDSFVPEAIDVMTRITRHEFNIYQFGQKRWKVGYNNYATDCIAKGFYDLTGKMPRRWAMVWNKIYKRSFIKKHNIKFIKGMQFGEDEMFNVRCILANGGLYHAPQILINHYFDDRKSLCRGELDVERLQGLIKELEKLLSKQNDLAKIEFINGCIVRHLGSNLFKRFGYHKQAKGSYDIVYFVREGKNEELRYSLRSVEENWQYNKVWFYGGCPTGIAPDEYVHCIQTELSKFERVRNMLYQACSNDKITESFWLFNDDFFVLQPKPETIKPMYNKTLQDRIAKIESRHGNMPTDYTKRLRHLVKTLEEAGLPTLDYAVHKPMLINRKKALEVLDKYPNEPMFRALYGNYWKLGGESNHDMKIQLVNYNKCATIMREWDFLSTSDESFEVGNVGRYLRDRFNTPSRFEV